MAKWAAWTSCHLLSCMLSALFGRTCALPTTTPAHQLHASKADANHSISDHSRSNLPVAIYPVISTTSGWKPYNGSVEHLSIAKSKHHAASFNKHTSHPSTSVLPHVAALVVNVTSSHHSAHPLANVTKIPTTSKLNAAVATLVNGTALIIAVPADLAADPLFRGNPGGIFDISVRPKESG